MPNINAKWQWPLLLQPTRFCETRPEQGASMLGVSNRQMFRRSGRNRVQNEVDFDALAHRSAHELQAPARNTFHRHQVGRPIHWKCAGEKEKLSTHWHYSDADSCQIWRNLPTLYQIVHRNNRQCLLKGANTAVRDVNIESDRFWPYFSNCFEILGEVQYYRWMQRRSVLP